MGQFPVGIMGKVVCAFSLGTLCMMCLAQGIMRYLVQNVIYERVIYAFLVLLFFGTIREAFLLSIIIMYVASGDTSRGSSRMIPAVFNDDSEVLDDQLDERLNELCSQAYDPSVRNTTTYQDDKDPSCSNGCICPICISSFVSGDKVVLGELCGHPFHFECITEWLRISARGRPRNYQRKCPYCRQSFFVREDRQARSSYDGSVAMANFVLLVCILLIGVQVVLIAADRIAL